MILGLGSELWFDRSAMLNREIGNALAGIERRALGSREDGIGRTSVDAAGTGTAAGRSRFVGDEWNREKKFAEEEPGTAGLVDQAGVFTDPAEAGGTGVRAFEERRGVDTDARFEWLLLSQGDRVDQGFEPPPEYIMVIRAPGVSGKLSLGLVLPIGRVGLASVVELADTNDALGRRQELARVAAQIPATIGEVGHLARHAKGSPDFEPGQVVRRNGRGNAHQFETTGVSEIFYGAC